METQFDEWLKRLRSDSRGPVTLPSVTRGRVFSETVALAGDWTGATLRAQARLYPDSETALATFSVAGPVVADGYSTFTLSLTTTETAAFPADDDFDGVEYFAFDVLFTPSGGTEGLLFGGVLPVIGRVTV